MTNLFFPQLSSGVQVQYPLRKRRLIRSVVNAFADGSMTTSKINADSRVTWDLAYSDLTREDQFALQSHFAACRGALSPFTFIDPTGNMLSSSGNLRTMPWYIDPQLSINTAAPDPLGGTSAFTLVNSSQVDQRLTQRLLAPAGYQYCFSVYVFSASPGSVSLARKARWTQVDRFAVGPDWRRITQSAKISDEQASFTVSVTVPAAQSVVVWGPQLEPQLSASNYRATAGSGGIYNNAHFLGNSLTFSSNAPGLFSTLISIETT